MPMSISDFRESWSPLTLQRIFREKAWSYSTSKLTVSISKHFHFRQVPSIIPSSTPASNVVRSDQTGLDGLQISVCSAPNPNLNYRPVIGILSHPGDGASGRLTNDTSLTYSYMAASYVKFAESGRVRVIPISVCSAPNPNLNYRPVIGILSHPGDGASGGLTNDTSLTYSYMAASYVKFAESGRVRVIPIIYNEPKDLIFQKLKLVNGVIFTGGWAKHDDYFDIVQNVFKKAVERNDAGEHFPVYGICLGFELISIIISQNRDILERFDAKDHASTLQFVQNANIDGTLFARFPPGLLKKLTTDCLVMQNHHYGISPATFQDNSALDSFFEILTTCVDENNKTYVSTVKAKRYPITGIQWHPEVTQQAASYLVSEARKSQNRPRSKNVLSNIIYNYKPTYCGYEGRGYDEVYIFTQPK